VLFLQSRKKSLGVQSLLLKLINNNCPELKTLVEGPRRDKRVNLSLVVLVVPLEDGELQIGKAFYAVTRDISTTGIGVIMAQQRALDEVIIGFRMEKEIIFCRANAKHLNPMGNGFYQLGMEIAEMIPNSKYPELEVFFKY
jgi:hypothetical protein